MAKKTNKNKRRFVTNKAYSFSINPWNTFLNRPRNFLFLALFIGVVGIALFITRSSYGQDLNAVTVAIPKTQYSYPSNAIFVSPTGNDSGTGAQSSPLKTVKSAISKISSGGTVVLRGGTYREELGTVSKSFILQPYPNEDAWLDGSDVVTGWVQDGSTWRKDNWTAGNTICAQSPCYDPNLVTSNDPTGGYPDMVFINGSQLKQVLSKTEVSGNTFYVDRSNQKLYIGLDPNGKTVESTTRNRLMYLQTAASGTQLKGIGVRRYASQMWFQRNLGQIQASDGLKDLLIEKVLFTEGAGSGLFLGGSSSARSTGNVIRDSIFAYNGLSGLNSNYVDGLNMDNNVFYKNNQSRGQDSGTYGSFAGAKFARLTNSTLKNNLFQENLAKGLWCDLQCNSNTIVGNLSRNNTSHGFFYEISKNAVIASNISIGNGGYGMKISGSGIQVYNNTTYNNNLHNIWVYNDPRSSTEEGEYTRNITLKNNISASDTKPSSGNYLISIQLDSTGAVNPSEAMTGMDYNMYFRVNGTVPTNILRWKGPSIDKSYSTLSNTLRTETGRETNSVGFDGKSIGSLFTDVANGDYRIPDGSSSLVQGDSLPADVATVMGLAAGSRPNIGAVSWRNKATTSTGGGTTVKVNVPPTATLSYSSPTTLTEPAAFEVTGNATDPDGSITKIEIYQNNNVVRTCSNATSCLYRGANYGKGAYTYFAKAYDNNDPVAISTSNSITYTINASSTTSGDPDPDPTPDPTPEPVADTQAPSIPGQINLTLSPDWRRFRYVLNATWGASTDNVGVTQYTIKRNNNIVGTTNKTSFTDVTLKGNSTYAYSVTASDAANNQSQPSTINAKVSCLMLWCSLQTY